MKSLYVYVYIYIYICVCVCVCVCVCHPKFSRNLFLKTIYSPLNLRIIFFIGIVLPCSVKTIDSYEISAQFFTHPLLKFYEIHLSCEIACTFAVSDDSTAKIDDPDYNNRESNDYRANRTGDKKNK